MARTPPAPVNPAVLRWAREEAALTPEAAAKKVPTDPAKLAAWEDGSARPTLNQLKSLARAYGRPPAFFFVSKPPRRTRPDIPDYRRGPRGRRDDEEHPETRRQLLNSLARRRDFLTLRHDVEPFPAATGPRAGAPTSAAAWFRTRLGVELGEQFAARDQYAALNLWVRAAENLDVLVFQASSLGTADMRGISVYLDLAPIILLRGKDAPAGRTFTLAHELGHLVRRTSGLCNPFQPAGTEVERWCNAFAAELLMPAEPFRREVAALADLKPVEAAYAAGRRFGASHEAAAIRMVELALAHRQVVDEARQRVADALAAYEDREGFAPHHRIRLRDLGRLYSTTVIDAYHSDRIGLTDAIQRLGIKVPAFRKIEAEVPSAGEQR